MTKHLNIIFALIFLCTDALAATSYTRTPNGAIIKEETSIGSNAAPDSDAVLDVVSTTKGFLPPRMTTVQRGNIATPTTGLQVYDTNLNMLMFYNGSAWVEVRDATKIQSKAVSSSAPSANQILKYNGTSWELAADGGGGGSGINILMGQNHNAEDGVVTPWTESGGGTLAVNSTAANVANGTYAFSFDASANADYAASPAITVPAGLFGANCLIETYYKGFDANLTALVSDGTNTLVSQTLAAAASGYTKLQLNFVCPSSGTLEFRWLASANAAIGYWDEVHLGSASNISNVSQATLAGESYFGSVANCRWVRTNTALGAFTADTDCTGPTVVRSSLGSWQTTDADLPIQTVNNLPPGIYKATFTVLQAMSINGYAALSINDGTTTCEGIAGNDPTTASSNTISCTFEYTSAGNRSFQLYGASSTGEMTVYNDSTAPDISPHFILERFPSSNETMMTAGTINWRVDANISGANFDLGTSDQATYIGMTSASMTLTNNATATLTAQIPCSTTNPPTGTTCSAGTEDNGVSFTIPRAGTVRACVSFGHAMTSGASGFIQSTFQIVETPANAQTISQEGKTRVSSAVSVASIGNHIPHRLCGTFKFDSAGQKTLRLFYEQDVNATVTTNVVLADASATLGQRDIHWEVYPIDQAIPAPLLVNSVVNDYAGVTRQCFGRITYSGGTPSVNSSTNGCLTINADNGAGDVTLNIVPPFAAAPYCTTTWEGAAASLAAASTASAVRPYSGFDVPALVKCEGAR